MYANRLLMYWVMRGMLPMLPTAPIGQAERARTGTSGN
jgi:hypothetical protein